MNATIITSHYNRGSRLSILVSYGVKEYKHTWDNYSWDDDVDFESENVKSTNSPKIYYLRTPQKKSRKTEAYSDDTSDMLFDLSKDDKNVKSRRT